MNIALIRTMDSQGRIVIPAEIRKQMKLSDGDALELENVGMELLLRKCPTHLNGKEEMASCNSIYRLSYTRVPMELEAMCA